MNTINAHARSSALDSAFQKPNILNSLNENRLLSSRSPSHREYIIVVLRSYFKNVFQPNICVGFAFQILDIFTICLRSETRIRLDLEPESYF